MPQVGNIFVTDEQLKNPRIRRAFLASQVAEEDRKKEESLFGVIPKLAKQVTDIIPPIREIPIRAAREVRDIFGRIVERGEIIGELPIKERAVRVLIEEPAKIGKVITGFTGAALSEAGKTIQEFIATGVVGTERAQEIVRGTPEQRKFEKEVLGFPFEPESFADYTEGIAKFLREQPETTPFEQKILPLTIPILLFGLDLTGIGGVARKNLTKFIAKSSDVNLIFKELRPVIKGTDKEVRQLSEGLVKLTKESEVEAVLKSGELPKVPRVIEPIPKELESLARTNPVLFRTAQKATNVDEFIDLVVKKDRTTRDKVSVPTLTDFFNRVKDVTKRPPTAQRILGIEKPRKIERREDVLLRERIRAEARGAKTAIAQFKREQKFLDSLKNDVQKELNKPKGKQRSVISFVKQLGEFKQTVITDIKKELGVKKPLKDMNLTELNNFVGKMKERLKFKFERGFRPSAITTEKLGIKAKTAEPPVITDKIYQANIEAQKVTIKVKLGDIVQKTRDEIDKTLGTISSRLADIDPSLRVALRRFIFNSSQRVIKDKKQVVPFLNKLKSLSKEDFVTFDFAAKNGDIKKQQELAKQFGFEKELSQIREQLDDIYSRANDVGFDIGYRKNFFPRIVKDTKGLVQFFSEADSPVKSIIDEAIKRKEMDLGRALSINEKAYLINNMIRGYSGGQITLSAVGNMKNRVIDFVTPEMNRFYFDTSNSVVQYIESVNRAIEARKFFGKSRIVDKKVDQFNNIDDSIGAYIMKLLSEGKIKPKDELELREILDAFFGEKGTRGVVSLYKNLAYIDVMGSPINALTQIGDLAFPIYNALVGNTGVFNTVAAFTRAIAGKSKITKADIGIEKIAIEFESTSKSANAVDLVFKITGLTKIDTIGKETLINPFISRFQQLGKKPTPEFLKEMNLIFEDEAPQLIRDLASGEITENVKFLAFNKLLDFQPIAKSEVPQRYLTGGNLRILYQLKTWTLKMFDVFRNEGFRTMETDKVRGIRNIIVLAMSLMVMNATADEIKDLVLGRKTSLKDRTIDNIAKLIGFSRYSVNQIAREGLGSAALEQVTPPTQAVDNISKDLVTIFKDWDKGVEISKLKIFKSIPIGGNLYYWWFGKGSDFKEIREKKAPVSLLKSTRTGFNPLLKGIRTGGNPLLKGL